MKRVRSETYPTAIGPVQISLKRNWRGSLGPLSIQLDWVCTKTHLCWCSRALTTMTRTWWFLWEYYTLWEKSWILVMFYSESDKIWITAPTKFMQWTVSSLLCRRQQAPVLRRQARAVQASRCCVGVAISQVLHEPYIKWILSPVLQLKINNVSFWELLIRKLRAIFCTVG